MKVNEPVLYVLRCSGFPSSGFWPFSETTGMTDGRHCLKKRRQAKPLEQNNRQFTFLLLLKTDDKLTTIFITIKQATEQLQNEWQATLGGPQ